MISTINREILLLEKLTGKKVALIKENSGGHSHGCVMLYFDFEKMKSIQDKIKKEDLYEDEPGYGLEKDPHLTLLYGLHSGKIKNDDNVFDTVLNFDISNKLELYNISLFKNDKYEVLKFDVRENKSDNYSKKDDVLYKINKKLTERFPYTNNYPDYHPHSTIAYLKPGEGKKYVDMFKDKTYNVTPIEIVYSKPDGLGKTKKKKILKESDSPSTEFGGTPTTLESLQKEFPNLVFTLTPVSEKRYIGKIELKNRGRELELIKSFDSPESKIDMLDTLSGEARRYYYNITNEKVILKEKKSKYLDVKDHIAKMHIPKEIKEKILALVNSGTRISKKYPVIHSLTKPTDFNKKVKEHNLPTGYELGADKNGFFVATHRARSKSYENAVDIPIKSIKFIDSTG